MLSFFVLSLCLLNGVQAAPNNQRFSSLRRQSTRGDTVITPKMLEHMVAARNLISFAADRVFYPSFKPKTAAGKPKNNIPVEELEKLFKGMIAAYNLEGFKAGGEGKPPGLACGLVNAIFFREFLMSFDKDAKLKPKSPGLAAHPSKYYLDFVTMSSGTSALHFHDGWNAMWKGAVTIANSHEGEQTFLVDDAFLMSPNCNEEVLAFKAAKKKPTLNIVFPKGNTPFFHLASATDAKKKLASADWFGPDAIKTAEYYVGDSNLWIPKTLQDLLKANAKWCNCKEYGT